MSLTSLSAQQLGALEPVRQNNVLLTIVDTNDDELLSLSVESFPLPKFSVNTRAVGYLNQKFKFPSNTELENIQVTFRDFVQGPTATNSTLEVLYAWYREVFDYTTGCFGFAEDFMRDGYVAWFTPDGWLSRRAGLRGVWPSALDLGEATHDGDGEVNKMMLTLEIVAVYPLDGPDFAWGSGAWGSGI
jgi:hypothetical protein